MSETPRVPMSDPSRRDEQVGENRRDQGFQEVPATQGLKNPPLKDVGENSGEWTRGGGTDPNELDDTQPSPGEPAK